MRTKLGKLNLGHGTKMSVPKAAVVWFFEGYKYSDPDALPPKWWDIGQFGASHEIVDIAGAKHCSAKTSRLVSDALGRSPLWDKERVYGLYSGYRGNTANPNSYTPSAKGRRWYEEVFKKQMS